MATHPARFTVTDSENYVPPVYLGSRSHAIAYAGYGYRKRLRLLRPDLHSKIDTVELIVTDTETGETYPA